MDPVAFKLGWAKFQEGATLRDDDVDLYVAEAKFSPVKEARLGVDFYVLRDASGSNATAGAGAGTFNTNLNTIGRIFSDYGVGATAFTYDPATFYYLGVDGAFKAGPVGLSGYAFYNWGKIEGVNGTIGGDAIANGDIDVKAYGGRPARRPGRRPRQALHRGQPMFPDRTGTATDFESPITASNYALAGSFPLTSMDMQILFPNIDDINASAALAYDVQNKGRGLVGGGGRFPDEAQRQLCPPRSASATWRMSKPPAAVSRSIRRSRSTRT